MNRFLVITGDDPKEPWIFDTEQEAKDFAAMYGDDVLIVEYLRLFDLQGDIVDSETE